MIKIGNHAVAIVWRLWKMGIWMDAYYRLSSSQTGLLKKKQTYPASLLHLIARPCSSSLQRGLGPRGQWPTGQPCEDPAAPTIATSTRFSMFSLQWQQELGALYAAVRGAQRRLWWICALGSYICRPSSPIDFNLYYTKTSLWKGIYKLRISTWRVSHGCFLGQTIRARCLRWWWRHVIGLSPCMLHCFFFSWGIF